MSLTDTITEARDTLAAHDAEIAARKSARDAFIAEHRAIYDADHAMARTIIDLQHAAAILRAALTPPKGAR